ncbi:type II toxin-antitoxin system HicB family antitoxin [Pseudomonadota bacterium]
MRYPIILHTDNHKDFGVTVPDLPGCFSAGDSIEQAIENACEAILAHTKVMAADGESIPEPSEIVDMKKFFPDEGTAFLAYVDVDMERVLSPAKRINITLRPAILRDIDRRAKARGMNRSEYLAYAGTHLEEPE